ncbi:MAG: HAMP domain-containing histidine kinase, partial [Gemmatimonadetes bacterium]|nr:HAMP domain-containing histidine kinase [Gemmatimonadota bacterium]
LRFSQDFDASELLTEYTLLGDVLYAFASDTVANTDNGTAAAAVACSHRIFRAISVAEQTTIAHYVRVQGERVAEREERLRRFSRMITHELKNRVGATLGAGQLLGEEWLGTEERLRFAGMVEQNAQAIQKALENLSALSRVDTRKRRERDMSLKDIVSDVFSQLRGLARGRGVELRVAGNLPDVEVNANAVELCLSNYVSNSIRFSDGSAAERWAEVEAEIGSPPDEPDSSQLIVRVRDNGIGVPPEARDQLFERFFRAHIDEAGTESTGLGLSLVKDTAAALGGHAWAELDGDSGSTFAFSVPLRPEGSQAAGGGGKVGSDEAGAEESISDGSGEGKAGSDGADAKESISDGSGGGKAVSGEAGAAKTTGDHPTDAAPEKESD